MKCSPNARACRSQTMRLVPSELPSTRTGASGGPSSEAVSRAGAVGSDIEEDRLPGARRVLQSDVEGELEGLANRLGDRDQGGPPLRGDAGEHGIRVVGRGLA